MAVLFNLVDCASLCQLLKAQHFSFYPNGCFKPLTPLWFPTCTPLIPNQLLRLPAPYKDNHDVIETKKLPQKSGAFKVACRNSYEMVAIRITRLLNNIL